MKCDGIAVYLHSSTMLAFFFNEVEEIRSAV